MAENTVIDSQQDPSAIWQRVADHFAKRVLPSGLEYRKAEVALSATFQKRTEAPAEFEAAQSEAVRKASELAVAFDGLVDRAAKASGQSKAEVMREVRDLCRINGHLREGAMARMSAVANAHKHDTLDDKRHPIRSSDDILAVGSGYGMDAYGVGKMGEPEVMVHQQDGSVWKFLGDGRACTEGWHAYLIAKGVDLPSL